MSLKVFFNTMLSGEHGELQGPLLALQQTDKIESKYQQTVGTLSAYTRKTKE